MVRFGDQWASYGVWRVSLGALSVLTPGRRPLFLTTFSGRAAKEEACWADAPLNRI